MRPRYAESAGRRLSAARLVRCCTLAVPLLLSACGSAPTLPPLEQYPQPGGQSPASASTELPSTAAPPASAEPVVTTTPDPGAAPEPVSDSGRKPSRFARQPKPEPSQQPAQPPPAATAPLVADGGMISPAAQQEFDQAVALAQSGDLAGAERAFDALTAQYPSYTGPLVNLGILRAKAGKLETAEQALKTAVERNPNNATAHNHLGIVYRRLGRFKEAEAAYQRAVEADPAYGNAYFNLGVLCDLYLQQPQRALEAFERYLQLTSEPDAKVTGWVKELKTRIGNSRSARSEQ